MYRPSHPNKTFFSMVDDPRNTKHDVSRCIKVKTPFHITFHTGKSSQNLDREQELQVDKLICDVKKTSALCKDYFSQEVKDTIDFIFSAGSRGVQATYICRNRENKELFRIGASIRLVRGYERMKTLFLKVPILKEPLNKKTRLTKKGNFARRPK